MAIPGREINSELESCPVGRLGYRFYDISFSIAPGTAGYIMFGIFTGPQAKAIVMLGRQDHQLNPCILQHPHPLIRIKISGIKQRRIFLSCAPLPVGKGIDTKMQKGGKLQLLPLVLPLRWRKASSLGDNSVQRLRRIEKSIVLARLLVPPLSFGFICTVKSGQSHKENTNPLKFYIANPFH